MRDIKTIFVVDDDKDDQKQAHYFLQKLLPDCNYVLCNTTDEIIHHFNAGVLPDVIRLDCSLEGIRNNHWGQDNADTIIRWFQENKPDQPLPILIFQSNDPQYAINASQHIQDHYDSDVIHYAAHSQELMQIHQLQNGQDPRYGYKQSSGFFKFFNDYYEYDFPLTEQELEAYKVKKNKKALSPENDKRGEVKNILVIDDEDRDIYAHAMEIIFPEATIRSINLTSQILAALDKAMPDIIVTDCNDTGLEQNDLFGMNNAYTAINWYGDHDCLDKLPVLLFMSATPKTAIATSQTILHYLKYNYDTHGKTCGFSKQEINKVTSFFEGSFTVNNVSENLGPFMNAHFVTQIPITDEDVREYVLKHKSPTLCKLVTVGSKERNAPLDIMEKLKFPLRDELEPSYYGTEVKSNGDDFDNDIPFRFKNAAGKSVNGRAAFSIDHVEHLIKQDKKPVLIIDDYSPDIIPHFGKLAGLVVINATDSGHLSVILNAHGVTGIINCDENTGGLEQIEFGQNLTIEINEYGAYLHTKHYDLIESNRGINNHFSTVSYWLYQWRQDNNIKPLHFKINIDHPHQLDNISGSTVNVGLMRTEHVALSDTKQLTSFKQAVLTMNDEALKDFNDGQYRDIQKILGNCSMDLTVRIRLIDLPPREAGFSDAEYQILSQNYGDSNIRGVQLATLFPALYEAQLRSIFRAVHDHIHEYEDTFSPEDIKLEIMVPTVKTLDELMFIKAMTHRIGKEMGFAPEDYRFGSMLETVEVCENIEAIATECDFLSIGSNDLTEAVLRCPRSDYQARHDTRLKHRRSKDPFLTLYDPVIDVIYDAVARARIANPSIQIDLCGAHGEDLDSLEKLRTLNLEGISVTPNEKNMEGLRILYDYNTFWIHTHPDKPEPAYLPSRDFRLH